MNRRAFGGLLLRMASPALLDDAPRHLLVPAYFYPSGKGKAEWGRLIASGREARITAVANPASGPGERPDPAYTEVLTRAERARLTLLGYATTSYGKRPAADVGADLDRWRRFYPQVRGAFLDEQSSGPEGVASARDVASRVRKIFPMGPIVSNPGTLCDEGYLAQGTSDVACLLEGPRKSAEFRPPRWLASYPRDRFAAIVYDVPDLAQAKAILARLSDAGVGMLYATDARGANPYDRLPSYWDELVAWFAASGPQSGRDRR